MKKLKIKKLICFLLMISNMFFITPVHILASNGSWDFPGLIYPISPNPSHPGRILINWTDIPEADNFSIYRYSSPITEINGSVTFLKKTNTSHYRDNESPTIPTFYPLVIIMFGFLGIAYLLKLKMNRSNK